MCRTDIDRFMRLFDCVPGPMPEECWVWRNCNFRFKKVKQSPHSWAWVHIRRQPFDRFKTIIRQKCGNPKCVRPEHLYAQSRRRLWLDRARVGRLNIPVGSRPGRVVRIPHAKLTPELVRYIRTATDRSCADIGRELGIAKNTILQARKGETWKRVGAEACALT